MEAPPRRAWRPPAAVAALLLLLSLLLPLLLSPCLNPRSGAALAAPGAVAEAPRPAAPPGSLTVLVGMYVRNIYGLSLRDQTFKVDGLYWLRVSPTVQALLQRRGISPLQMVQFVNQVDPWDGVIEQVEADPPPGPDGSRLFSFRFAANFYVDEIDQRRSPFEWIHLPLILETNLESLNEQDPRVRLLPESGSSRGLLGDYSSNYGYQLRRVSVRPSEHRYPTRFGSNRDHTSSRIELLIDYAPDPWAMFAQWILPLLLVMGLVLLAPSLDVTLRDARLAIPPTALLTLVFLQQSYKAELPPTSYLTFLDHLYTYGYAVSVGLFVLFLWDSNQMEAVTEAQRQQLIRRINRVDLRCQLGALAGLVVVALIAWYR